MSKGLEALEFLRRNYCVLKSERKNACDIIEKELKALIVLKEMLQLKVYKNKLGQCFLEGINILMPIDHETYDLLKEVLKCQDKD